MAFPTTAVLDDFNRANGAIGANWTNKVIGTEPDTLTVFSNATSTSAGDFASGWWNVAQFGPDCEAYYTSVKLDSTQSLYCNLQTPGSAAVDGYEQRMGGTVRVFRLDNGVATELGSGDSYTGADGDSFGIENIGGSITPYWKVGAGSWSALASRTDATYGTGFIGLWNLEGANFCVQDNFGGGTIASPPPAASPTLRVMQSGLRW